MTMSIIDAEAYILHSSITYMCIKNLNPKKNIENDYIIGLSIGNGRFGTIKHGININTKEMVAIKIININFLKLGHPERHEIILVNEVSLMKKCDHPHIIKYIDFYEDKKNYYIVPFAEATF